MALTFCWMILFPAKWTEVCYPRSRTASFRASNGAVERDPSVTSLWEMSNSKYLSPPTHWSFTHVYRLLDFRCLNCQWGHLPGRWSSHPYSKKGCLQLFSHGITSTHGARLPRGGPSSCRFDSGGKIYWWNPLCPFLTKRLIGVPCPRKKARSRGSRCSKARSSILYT